LGLVAFFGLVIGFMGIGWSLAIQLIVGVVAAVVAGVVRGAAAKERILCSSAFLVAEIGIIVATRIYSEGRSSVWNFELLIPLLLGSVPGLIVYFLVSKFGISKRSAEG
jgi:multisubunit Na+/H+ antiporter MnhF subunit